MIPQAWEGTASEELVMVDMKNDKGELYEYRDRRQEIVMIGHRMKRDNIQELLDSCLLTEEEMALGPEMWMETMSHLDVIQLTLNDAEDEEEEEEEEKECTMEDCEDKVCNLTIE